MEGMMTTADAQARLGEMADGGELVEFINSGAEVQLHGTFNVEDLEALYVLMVHGDTP